MSTASTGRASRQVAHLLQGKVRDTYDLGDKLAIVTTDRQSAFDRLLASIPFKGQVLNQTSAWWFKNTQQIVQNALLATPDPNVAVMKKCTVFPVEFVVRGFMTGSTDTSLWTVYRHGAREYCGNALPDGMRKNDKLAQNIITPTTKAADHDVPISPQDIVAQVRPHPQAVCGYLCYAARHHDMATACTTYKSIVCTCLTVPMHTCCVNAKVLARTTHNDMQ